MPNLTTSYLGLNLKNPIIAASSGLTDSVDEILTLEKAGVAAVVLKSLFEEEIIIEMEAKLKKMASENFLYPESLEFYEEHTEENSSLHYLELIKTVKSRLNIPVIASINCITSEHWTYFPRQIELAGADALELNIFRLPSEINSKKEQSENVYFDIIKKVTDRIKIPVAIKVSTYFSDLASILQRFSQTNISGLVLFNKFYNPDFDIENMEIVSGKVLSTPDDYHNTLRWISIMYGRVDCNLVATTGIHDGETVLKMILAGADAVQIASAIYQKGPALIENMISSIHFWMERKGFDSLNDFKGMMSQKESMNPAAYERVQFMKYFRGYTK